MNKGKLNTHPSDYHLKRFLRTGSSSDKSPPYMDITPQVRKLKKSIYKEKPV